MAVRAAQVCTVLAPPNLRMYFVYKITKALSLIKLRTKKFFYLSTIC